jgi:AhpD family alkylhydroperoxidase
MTMRIEPIEKPRGPFLRLAYRMLRRQFGKTITPWKVVFARAPKLLPAQIAIYWGLDRGLSIPAELRLLLQHRVAGLNGCRFCLDIGRAIALRRHLSLGKAEAVADWVASPLFDARERAALAYVEEATRVKRVSDATFAALRAHFDDREIVEITWLCAVENFFNLINLPLGIESDGLCALAERGASATGTAAAAPRCADS